jgi:hypothetical protein
VGKAESLARILLIHRKAMEIVRPVVMQQGSDPAAGKPLVKKSNARGETYVPFP